MAYACRSALAHGRERFRVALHHRLPSCSSCSRHHIASGSGSLAGPRVNLRSGFASGILSTSTGTNGPADSASASAPAVSRPGSSAPRSRWSFAVSGAVSLLLFAAAGESTATHAERGHRIPVRSGRLVRRRPGRTSVNERFFGRLVVVLLYVSASQRDRVGLPSIGVTVTVSLCRHCAVTNFGLFTARRTNTLTGMTATYENDRSTCSTPGRRRARRLTHSSSPAPRAAGSGTTRATATSTSPASWSTSTSAISTRSSSRRSRSRPTSSAPIAPFHANDARSEAARLIAELAPGDLDMVFFTNGGAEAHRERDPHGAPAHRACKGAGDVPQLSRRDRTARSRSPATPPRGRASRACPASCTSGARIRTARRSTPLTTAQECRARSAHLPDTIMVEGRHTIAAIMLETVVGTNGILVPPRRLPRRRARAVRRATAS